MTLKGHDVWTGIQAKHHLKLVPERRIAFAERDTEVDGVREWMINVRPFVRGDGVITANFAVQRPHEDHIRVDVDSAVLDHEVDAPHVRHVRDIVHCVSVYLRTVTFENYE